MAKGRKVENLIPIFYEDISFDRLKNLKKEYYKLLQDNVFPIPEPNKVDAISMIHYLKRKDENQPQKIGIYSNITVFEAANRIASDLVIINGVLQIIAENKELKDSKITIRLGTKHEKEKGDFSINGKEGEAFNVAESFFKDKLHKTTTKWKQINKVSPTVSLTYILVNSDVIKESDRTKLLPIQLISVRNWDDGFER